MVSPEHFWESAVVLSQVVQLQWGTERDELTAKLAGESEVQRLFRPIDWRRIQQLADG
jgi:hypothetical protein